jgi:hypothetical protein
VDLYSRLEKNGITFNTDEWIYTAGIPDNQSIIKSNKFENVEKTLKHFIENNTASVDVTKDWTTQEWVHFINNFPGQIERKHLVLFDDAFDLTNSSNSYIAMVWYEQAVNHDYHGNNVDVNIENFLINVGRRWYVSTIYKAYKRNGKVEEALVIYNKARPNYHSKTVKTIDDLLGFQK